MPSDTAAPFLFDQDPASPAAWNGFVQAHAAAVLQAVSGWCERGCRVARGGYACVLRVISTAAPERAEAPDHCDETLALFTWAFAQLRDRLGTYRGLASPAGWVQLQLLELEDTYRQGARGRLTLPPPLLEAAGEAQAVFRLSCRTRDRAHAMAVLGLDDAAMAEAEAVVRQRLSEARLAWWPWEDGSAGAPVAGPASPLCDAGEAVAALVERRLDEEGVTALGEHLGGCTRCRERRRVLERLRAQPELAPEVPAWLLRAALDRSSSDAPEPTASHRGWRARLLTQPDWLAGLVVGGVLCVFMLLVVLPRQEYARPVIAPEDEVLAVAATPLSEPLARRLAEARKQLRRGQIEAAVQNLNAVVASRPDEQEARWLLASTYDRLGDQTRAAKHYKVYLHVHDRRNLIEDGRARRIRQRLGRWEQDTP